MLARSPTLVGRTAFLLSLRRLSLASIPAHLSFQPTIAIIPIHTTHTSSTKMTSSPSSSSSAASTSPSYTTSAFPELTPHIQPSSSTALSALLSANHASHHCFFNTRGMHNHSLHELIADLTLGASPTQLQTHYAYQIKHYLSGFTLNDRTKYNPHFAANNVNVNVKIEKKISEGNWREYVGDARYYWSYLRFFEVQVERFGLREVLERYVFGEEANEGEGEGMMMARFYGGVLHALIHFGYALEMREGKIAAEALAMATSTAASHAWLFDYDWLFERVEGVKGERKGLLELVGEIQRDERLSVDALGLKEEDASLPDRPFEGKGRGGGGGDSGVCGSIGCCG